MAFYSACAALVLSLAGSAVADCQSYGIDYENGGTYFQNSNTNQTFTASQMFNGCSNDTSHNIIVDPNGGQTECTQTSMLPNNASQLITCSEWSNKNMYSGAWSILVISNNNNGSAIAFQRDFTLDVGPPNATVTANPKTTNTVYATATSYVSVTSYVSTTSYILNTGNSSSTQASTSSDSGSTSASASASGSASSSGSNTGSSESASESGSASESASASSSASASESASASGSSSPSAPASTTAPASSQHSGSASASASSSFQVTTLSTSVPTPTITNTSTQAKSEKSAEITSTVTSWSYTTETTTATGIASECKKSGPSTLATSTRPSWHTYRPDPIAKIFPSILGQLDEIAASVIRNAQSTGVQARSTPMPMSAKFKRAVAGGREVTDELKAAFVEERAALLQENSRNVAKRHPDNFTTTYYTGSTVTHEITSYVSTAVLSTTVYSTTTEVGVVGRDVQTASPSTVTLTSTVWETVTETPACTHGAFARRF